MHIAPLAKTVGGPFRPVQLIEVDTIGLQAPKVALQRLCQLLPGVAWSAPEVMKLAAGARGFGREDPIVPAAGLAEPTADVLFGSTLGFLSGRYRVHLGGIHKIDAMLQGITYLVVGLGFRVLLAPGHSAQTNTGDGTAVDRGQAHRMQSLTVGLPGTRAPGPDGGPWRRRLPSVACRH